MEVKIVGMAITVLYQACAYPPIGRFCEILCTTDTMQNSMQPLVHCLQHKIDANFVP